MDEKPAIRIWIFETPSAGLQGASTPDKTLFKNGDFFFFEFSVRRTP
jgi:hypothetical protein